MGLKAICKSHLIYMDNGLVEALYLNAVFPQSVEPVLCSASSGVHQGIKAKRCKKCKEIPDMSLGFI